MSEDRTQEFFSLCQSVSNSGDVSIPKPSLHSLPTTVHDNLTDHHHAGATSARGGGATVAGQYGGRYGAPGAAVCDPDDPASALRHFHGTASEISRDIAATSALLSELTQLVRRKTLFVDDTERVNWLVLRIKSNVEGLNGRLEETGTVIARSKRRLGSKSQQGQEASNLVGQLQEEFVKTTSGFKKVLQQRSDNLKSKADRKRDVMGGGGGERSASAPASGAGGGAESLVMQSKPTVYGDIGGGGGADDKTPGPGGPGSFLEANAGIGGGGGLQPLGGPRLDLTSAFMAQNMGTPAGESSSSLPRPHGAAGRVGDPYTPAMGLRQRHNSLGEGSPGALERSYSEPPDLYDHGSGHGGIGGAPMTPLDMQRMEAESGQQEMMQLIPDQSYLQERADAMSQVETNIVELGTVFNKLAVMVSEHRELVTRVEDNVDDANETINLSLAQLTDTLENLRTNRALALKVFSVVVVFIILFITFFA